MAQPRWRREGELKLTNGGAYIRLPIYIYETLDTCGTMETLRQAGQKVGEMLGTESQTGAPGSTGQPTWATGWVLRVSELLRREGSSMLHPQPPRDGS